MYVLYNTSKEKFHFESFGKVFYQYREETPSYNDDVIELDLEMVNKDKLYEQLDELIKEKVNEVVEFYKIKENYYKFDTLMSFQRDFRKIAVDSGNQEYVIFYNRFSDIIHTFKSYTIGNVEHIINNYKLYDPVNYDIIRVDEKEIINRTKVIDYVIKDNFVIFNFEDEYMKDTQDIFLKFLNINNYE